MNVTAIRLDEKIIRAAKIAAVAQNRSVPKQIEYWTRVGRIAQENPDWTFDVIQGILQGMADLDTGDVEPYAFERA